MLSHAQREQQKTSWLTQAAIVLFALVGTGCAHEISLIPREGGGREYKSTIIIDSFGEHFSGPIRITIDGVTYSGTYAYSPSDYGFTLLDEYCPSHGNTVRKQSEWYGRAVFLAPNGKQLICEYKGSRSKGGYGVCLSSEGNVYDMLISP
jgi:hypothetical protein